MLEFVAYLLACWILADLLSGVGHWLEDRYFRADWPIVGKWIAAPNERHHVEPLAFTAGNYWRRNWTTLAVAAVPLLATCFWTRWSLVFLLVSQSNEIHAWSHQRCGRLIRTLQETGLIQSPRQHGEHHRAPFDRRYCVMSNLCNPLLDLLRVWLLLEFCFSLLGIQPKGTA